MQYISQNTASQFTIPKKKKKEDLNQTEDSMFITKVYVIVLDLL